jgi:hypothetical protein
MTACACESCRPDDPAPTYTERFRHECEVRYISLLDDPREYLAGVVKTRGVTAQQRLIADLAQLRELGRKVAGLRDDAERRAYCETLAAERGADYAQGVKRVAWLQMQGGCE